MCIAASCLREAGQLDDALAEFQKATDDRSLQFHRPAGSRDTPSR